MRLCALLADATLYVMMEEQIRRFPEEFSFTPTVVRGERIPRDVPIVILGMGGSHLGARLLSLSPSCPPLLIHSDYGLPALPSAWQATALHIGVSYSGETEEIIDGVTTAHDHGFPVAAISSGGALEALATTYSIPFVSLPQPGLEPRMAVGYQMLAIAALLKNDALLQEVREAGDTLSLEEASAAGRALAGSIMNRTPIFYASERNRPIAYHLKANMNETAKIPAFYSILPEACHNELSGYETENKGHLPVFLEDVADDERVRARMTLMKTMLEERRVGPISFTLSGSSPLSKGLFAVIAGSYAGAALAANAGVHDAATPLIAEFKERLTEST